MSTRTKKPASKPVSKKTSPTVAAAAPAAAPWSVHPASTGTLWVVHVRSDPKRSTTVVAEHWYQARTAGSAELGAALLDCDAARVGAKPKASDLGYVVRWEWSVSVPLSPATLPRVRTVVKEPEWYDMEEWFPPTREVDARALFEKVSAGETRHVQRRNARIERAAFPKISKMK